MKAKFLRDDIQYVGPPEFHKDDTEMREVYRNGEDVKLRFWKKGAVINHPKSFRLVQQGICEPADAECEHRANMNPDRMKAAGHAYERLKRGIQPQDFERYDRGELLGYNPDGSDIPGPNAVTFDDVESEDDDDEEE